MTTGSTGTAAAGSFGLFGDPFGRPLPRLGKVVAAASIFIYSERYYDSRDDSDKERHARPLSRVLRDSSTSLYDAKHARPLPVSPAPPSRTGAFQATLSTCDDRAKPLRKMSWDRYQCCIRSVYVGAYRAPSVGELRVRLGNRPCFI